MENRLWATIDGPDAYAALSDFAAAMKAIADAEWEQPANTEKE